VIQIAYNARWAAALLLAGLFSIWTVLGWVRIAKAFGLWFGLVRHKGKLVSRERLGLRLATCEKCALFYRPLKTCGTPVIKELRAMGCLCYMPEAAKLNDKRCYLDEHIESGYPGGWQHAGADPRAG